MSVLLILFLLLCANQMKFAQDGFFPDYLSREATTSIKGIFVVLVFFSHFCGYLDVSAIPNSGLLRAFNSYNGQTIVAMFLFYSGFGIMEAIRRKGMDYVRALPVQRCLRILLHFDLAVVLFLIVRTALGRSTGLKQFLLSLITWDSIGNSNWYVFVALMTYLLTFVAFSVSKERYYLGAALTTVLCLALIAGLTHVKDYWWYNTILCYVLGLWYSLLHEKIEAFLRRDPICYYGAVLAVFVVHILSHMHKSTIIPFELATVLTFTVLVVLITMKVRIDNPLLRFFGRHTFSFYILQRIPMWVFSVKLNVMKHPYYYFLLSFLCMIVLGLVFDKVTDRLDRALFARGAKSKETAS